MSPFYSLGEGIVYSLSCLGTALAADIFFREFFKSTVRKESFCILLLSVGRPMFSIFTVIWGLPYIIWAIIWHMFFLGVLFFTFQGEQEKKILAGAMLILVLVLTGNFWESFLIGITLIVRHTVFGASVPFLGEQGSIIICAVTTIISVGVILLLKKYMGTVLYGKKKRWYVIMSVPLFLLIAVVDIVNWGASRGISVKYAHDGNLYYDQLFSHGEICVLTLLCMFAAVVYVFGMDRIYVEQLKNERFSGQLAVYQMLWEEDKKRERLRHDMKNHVIALKGLLENREWEKMDRYLASMEESGSLNNIGELTGNPVVDALLYRKQKKAEEKNIRWSCDVKLPAKCPVDDFELCVLLGNMLDNAIEGCEHLSDSFIQVSVHSVKKCLLFEVKNSTDLKEAPKIGFSGKEEPLEHGIGLMNIRDVAERYNGVVKLEVEHGVFGIFILVPFVERAMDKE